MTRNLIVLMNFHIFDRYYVFNSTCPRSGQTDLHMKRLIVLMFSASMVFAGCDNVDDVVDGPDGGDGGDGSSGPTASDYAFVDRIDRKVAFWSELPAFERYEEDVTYTFKYDEKNRVVSYTVDIVPQESQGEPVRLVSTIDYSATGCLSIEEQWSDVGTQSYKVLLNDKGYVRQCESHPYSHDDNGYEFYTYVIGYDDEDRISSVCYSEEKCSYVYENGVLSSGIYSDGSETNEETGFEQDFNQIPNNTMNLDINMLFLSGFLLEEPGAGEVPGRLGRLAMLRLAGRGMDRYTTMFSGLSEEADANVAGGVYLTPNEVIHRSYEYFNYDEDEIQAPLEYSLNEDGTVASVTARATVVKSRHEYDIVVSDELVNPEFPEAGYKFQIENPKDTELGRGTNSITYTFTYR